MPAALALRTGSLSQGNRIVFKGRRTPVVHYKQDSSAALINAPLITEAAVQKLEVDMHSGAAIPSLVRFNKALLDLDEHNWQERLKPVLAELCFNLESFNPAFAAVILRVQSTIGNSDYLRRDAALKQLIVPLAGEYGMHNGEQQSKTHRELFDDWVQSMIGSTASDLVATCREPMHARLMFDNMMRDISSGGGVPACPLTHATYALGYNLAIEYLADYEKRWMLEGFRKLDGRFMKKQGCNVDWVFLEVHAEDEKEHAAIGHNAVTSLVPSELEGVVARAMHDHDRDFAAFYNGIAELLEGKCSCCEGN